MTSLLNTAALALALVAVFFDRFLIPLARLSWAAVAASPPPAPLPPSDRLSKDPLVSGFRYRPLLSQLAASTAARAPDLESMTRAQLKEMAGVKRNLSKAELIRRIRRSPVPVS